MSYSIWGLHLNLFSFKDIFVISKWRTWRSHVGRLVWYNAIDFLVLRKGLSFYCALFEALCISRINSLVSRNEATFPYFVIWLDQYRAYRVPSPFHLCIKLQQISFMLLWYMPISMNLFYKVFFDPPCHSFWHPVNQLITGRNCQENRLRRFCFSAFSTLNH